MSRAPLQIVVLIDALGWSYIEGRDFLSDLLPHRQPLRTILGYSSGAIPTILTGRPPAEHGHWNLLYYDPEGSPFRWLRRARFLPDGVLGHRITRKLLKEAGRRLLGLGPLFECAVHPRLLPCFNWAEKRNIYAPGGIPGAPSIFDRLAAAGTPYRVYSYHEGRDAELLHRAQQDIAAGEARFFFVYLSEMDAFLHQHCHDRARWEGRLDWYAASLRPLFETALARDREATLTLLSDHGMTPVRHQHDVAREIGALGLTMPGDYLAVYDSTMARFWLFSGRARDRIVGRLASLTCGRIVPEDEMQALGILFPDRRYGEVVFLLEPGWLIAHGDFNGASWMPTGMHGYHPDDPYSDGIFLSRQEPPVPMRTIADPYACMAHAARLQDTRAKAEIR